MTAAMKNDPRLMIKLTATSMVLSAALAKLNAYKVDFMNEILQDREYVRALQEAYLACSDDDTLFSEQLSGISSEVDTLMLELNKGDDE